MIKRVIAGALSAALCTTMVLSNGNKFITSIDPESKNNASIDRVSNLDFESSNSLGNFITHAAEEDQTVKKLANTDVSDSDYMVTGLDYDPATGKIVVTSTQPYDSKFVITFVDEKNGELFASVEGTAEAGRLKRSEASVDASKLGEYFIIKVQLFDLFNHPVGDTFVVKKYTEEVADILSKTTKDFSQDRVVNFDDDETNNFVVLSDDTVIAESADGKNELVSSDFDNNVFVFSNADDTVKNLEKGEFFYIQPSPEAIVSIAVEDVKIDGDTVTVSGNSNIDDMLAFVKFESHSDPRDAVLDMETADEGIVRTDTDFEETGVMTFDMAQYLLSYSKTASESFTLSGDIPLGNSGISLGAEAGVSFTQSFEFYKEWGYTYAYFELSTEFSFSIQLSADNGDNDVLKNLKEKECEPRIGSVVIPTGIPGATVKISVDFVLELEGSLGVTFSGTTIHGFQYDTDDGMEPIDKTEEKSKGITVKLEGEAFVGIKLSASLDAVDLGFITLLEFSLYAKAGLDITGSLEFSYAKSGESKSFSNTAFVCFDTSGDTKHACDTCLSGDVSFVVTAGVEFKCLKIVDIECEIASFSIKLFDWYLSLDNLGLVAGAAGLPASWIASAGLAKFGIGSCPNVAYKTTFNVTATNSDGDTFTPNVEIIVDGDVSTGVVGGSNVVVYCKSGSHTVDVIIDGKNVKHTSFHINNKTKELNYSFDLSDEGNYSSDGASSSDGAPIVTTTATTNHVKRSVTTAKAPDPDHYCLESGSLGDHIVYMLYPTGYMYIFGHGDMYDFNYTPIRNISKVKNVVMENYDTEHGYVINNIGASVFYGGSNIETVEMPKSVKSFGNFAFYNCSKFNHIIYDHEHDDDPESFVLPYDTTYIGNNAFYNCSSAKFGDVKFADTLTYIGSSAFYNCVGITGVTVPKTVTSIGDSAFRYCTSMVYADVKDGVGNIERAAFANCTALESLTLPYAGRSLAEVNEGESPYPVSFLFYYSGTGTYSGYYSGIPATLTNIVITGGTRVPDNAFYGFTSLKTISLPESVTSIGNNSFYNCSSLEFNKGLMTNKLVSIGHSAFYNCCSAKFDNIEFPTSLKTIGNSAFYNCTGITSLYIPGTVESVGDSAFRYCTSIKSIVVDNGVGTLSRAVFANCTSLESLTLPYAGLNLAEVNEGESPYPVSFLFYYSGTGTYSGYYSGIPAKLSKIAITGGTRVPDNSFYGFTSLKTISLPESVTSIGNNSFFNCTSLEFNKELMTNKLVSIGHSAFYNCNSAKFDNIDFPTSLKTIGNSAFYNCTGITNITIPGTVESVGDSAFRYCSSIKSIVVDKGVGTLSRAVFANCTSLESLTLPYAGLNLAEVNEGDSPYPVSFLFYYSGTGTYSGYYSGIPATLTNIVITGGNKVPNNSFYGFTSLKTISLPESVTYIGSNAFFNCTSLEFNEGLMTNKLTAIGSSAFYNCNSAKFNNICFPTSLTTIGNSAFYNCTGITSIIIPGTVKTIGDSAFRYCSNIKKAVVEDGVESISRAVFANCTSLESLTLPYAGTSLEEVNKEDSNCPVSYLFYYGGTGTYSGYYSGIPATLTSITITGGTRVPDNAFYGFTNLVNATLPSGLDSIGNNAFYNCSNLEFSKGLMTNDLETIGNAAFYNCSSANFNNIEFPTSLTTIGNSAFYNCKGITSIVIPGTVKAIGDSAFRYCSNMEEVVVENGVESLNRAVFANCTSLESLTLPFAGTSLDEVNGDGSTSCVSFLFYYGGEGTYSGYYGGIPATLANVTITGGNKIPSYAFYGFSKLKHISISDSVTSIGNNAFYNCSDLEFDTDIFKNRLESIGNGAFYNCSSANFGDIEFQPPLSYIGSSAFYNCTGITSIDIVGTVETVGDSAFRYCTGMTTAVIDNGTGKIERATFANCTALESLTLPYAGTSLDDVNAENSSSAVSYLFYYSGEGTYSGYYGGIPATLANVTITGGERIPNNAFYGLSKVSNITIPNKIKTIGSNSFYNCSGLETLYYTGTEETWPNIAIDGGNTAIDGKVVCLGAKIINQPVGAIAEDGSDVEFTVEAEGEDLLYSWSYSVQSGINWQDIRNKNSDPSTLVVPASADNNGYSYQCMIVDKYGNQIFSDAAKLTVVPAEDKTQETETPAETETVIETEEDTAA